MSYEQLVASVDALRDTNEELASTVLATQVAASAAKNQAIAARDQSESFAIDALGYVEQCQDLTIEAQQAVVDAEGAATTKVNQFATTLAGPTGANNVGYLSALAGAIKMPLSNKLKYVINTEEFGAIADGNLHPLSERYTTLAEAQAFFPFVTSLTQSIDWAAGQAALYAAEFFPCRVEWKPGIHVLTNTYTWCGGAWMHGTPGRTVWKLATNANCTVLQSRNIAQWEAFIAGNSTAGYPIDGGIDGIIIDGNAAEQSIVSTSASDLIYGLRIHSHRFGIGWLQVRRVKGVGCYTQYSSVIMYSYRTDGVDDYGLQGSPLGSPSPYDFKQINVIDTLYEAFVFKGPGDIPIWHLTTNYCGWLDNATIPTTARTSLLFPGEEIHSVRIETACKIGYLNSNGALYGRSLYVAPFTRFHGDSIIVTGSWGAMLIEGSAFGSISALSIQQNTYAWEGVYKPGLEIKYGTSSTINKNRFSFPQVSLRRLTTPVTANAIGPGILDNAGAQFGIIDGIDSNPVAGHGLVIGATNRGGTYESVNFDSIQGASHDGSTSAAVLVESGARDWRIVELRLTNCSRNFVNLGTNMRGIVRDGTIEVVTGQIALEGVVAASQVASVIAGVGNIALDNIASWGLEILHDSSRYYNRFKTTVTFDGSVAGAQTSAATAHTMWRTPAPRDVITSVHFGGTTWPNISTGIRTLAADTFTAAAFVHTASAGTVTVAVSIG